MLARLATVAFDAGLPDSRRRLREALREVRDRDSRVDVLTRLAALNVVDTADAGLAQRVRAGARGRARSATRGWRSRPPRSTR